MPEATYSLGDGASSVLKPLSEARWTLHRAAAQHNALMTLMIRNNSLIGSGSKVGENLKPQNRTLNDVFYDAILIVSAELSYCADYIVSFGS